MFEAENLLPFIITDTDQVFGQIVAQINRFSADETGCGSAGILKMKVVCFCNLIEVIVISLLCVLDHSRP